MATDEFLQPGGRRDFALLVEGTKVYVCRDYLACHSLIFDKIFYHGSFKTGDEGGGMRMKDKNLSEFLTFLHAVCPAPIVKKVDDGSVAVLLAYADEYDMADLRQRCVELMAKRLRKANLSQALSLEAVLAYAEKYNMKEVQGKAMAFMKSQLGNGAVTGAALIDYLKLAIQYDLGPLKKQLVPLVAQLSTEQIKASHSALPASVLAAVYESRWLHAEHRLADAELPRHHYECQYCCGNRSSSYPNGFAPYCNGCGQVMVMVQDDLPAGACKTCTKSLSGAAAAPNGKCVCRYADFSAELLDHN